ncbi:MAG: phosphomethylpyrimidine synthase ThiC, partial [Dissulfurimicrobium sp.]
MKTQIQYAREGVITKEIKAVSNDEGMDAKDVRSRVASGAIVILNSRTRDQR